VKSLSGEGERADQSGPAPGGACTDKRGLGAERVVTDRYQQIRIVRSGTDGCDGVHGVLQLGDLCCPLRSSEVTGDEVDAVAGGSRVVGEG
jgi:hypothetical protein